MSWSPPIPTKKHGRDRESPSRTGIEGNLGVESFSALVIRAYAFDIKVTCIQHWNLCLEDPRQALHPLTFYTLLWIYPFDFSQRPSMTSASLSSCSMGAWKVWLIDVQVSQILGNGYRVDASVGPFASSCPPGYFLRRRPSSKGLRPKS